MPPTKTAPANRKEAAPPKGAASGLASSTRLRYGAAIGAIVVVGLAIGLAVGLSTSNPKKSSPPLHGKAADLSQIQRSLAKTKQIVNAFLAQNTACGNNVACVANAAYLSLSPAGNAANLVHQTYFPQAAEGDGQAYVNELIAIQMVFKDIGGSMKLSVAESYVPALRIDMSKAVTAAHTVEGAL